VGQEPRAKKRKNRTEGLLLFRLQLLGRSAEPREKITGCLHQIALLCLVIRFVLAQGVEYGNVLREVLVQVVSRNAVLTVRDKEGGLPRGGRGKRSGITMRSC